MTNKVFIHTDKAPLNVGINAGNFSQAVRVGDTVYIGGTLAIDSETMELVLDDPEKEVSTAYKNLNSICRAAGGNMQDIVMLHVLLTDLTYLPIVNDVQGKYIKAPHPARSVMQVVSLPHGNKIELVAIMHLPI